MKALHPDHEALLRAALSVVTTLRDGTLPNLAAAQAQHPNKALTEAQKQVTACVTGLKLAIKNRTGSAPRAAVVRNLPCWTLPAHTGRHQVTPTDMAEIGAKLDDMLRGVGL